MKCKGGQDGYAALPQNPGRGQTGQEALRAVLQIMAHQVRGRGIHQVPIVDPAGVFQVEAVDSTPDGVVAAIIPVDQEQQGQQPVFVEGGGEKTFGRGQGR